MPQKYLGRHVNIMLEVRAETDTSKQKWSFEGVSVMFTRASDTKLHNVAEIHSFLTIGF